MRNITYSIKAAIIVAALFTCWYYYRTSSKRPDLPHYAVFISSVIVASCLAIFSAGIGAVAEWLHLLPMLPGTANTKDMLCVECWEVQSYRAELVCSKCGGRCEDAKYWTWIDDQDTSTLKK